MSEKINSDFIELLTDNGAMLTMILLVLISIFNSSLKGFVYLFGSVVLYFIVNFLTTLSGGINCDKCFDSAVYVFTIIYLLIPMVEHNTFNVPLMMFLMILYSYFMFKQNGEGNIKYILLSSVVGFIWGGLYYVILTGSDETKQMLYYNEFNSSNRVACLRPSKTNFKCSVYKNGELIK